MSLHNTDSYVIEAGTATESLPDPTTVSGRTHFLTNTSTANQVWSSTGATPFSVNSVNSATYTLAAGTGIQFQSDGTRWTARSSTAPAAATLGTVNLTPQLAIMPDASASNLAPEFLRIKSSAAAPSPYFYQLNFDAAVDEFVTFQFTMPKNYASGPILKVSFKMTSAVAGDVVFDSRVMAITPNDAIDMDTRSFAAANAYVRTVAAVAGYIVNMNMTLTNDDSVAAGDEVVLYFARLGSNGSDTAVGDCEVVAAYVEYTTL